MNYLLKNSQRGKKTSRQALLACMVIIILVLLYFFAPNFVNDTLFAVAKPIWNAQDYTVDKYEKIYALFSEKQELTKLNANLKRELDEATTVLQSLEVYKRENENLKSLLLGRESGEKRILANIMAKPNHSLYDTLLLDVGTKNEVAIGDKVLAGDFVLGTVREVYESHSKATLLSSPGEISRVIIGETNISAEALGRGAGNFIVKVPKEITVTQGDIIRMPDLNPKFFGTVQNVEQTVTSTFQLVLFRIPVNINNLQWVEVVKSE
ncbi:MAG: rod shape-determining protein MreC [bacterium]|nr:rod shape-determining protein MreC [bacterium]